LDIDRVSRVIEAPVQISLSKAELQEAILVATGHHLKAVSRFADGAFSIPYRVLIEEDPQIQYILQLRHHGNVTSMDLLMRLIASSVNSSLLPLPAVYPIPNEEQRQKATGMGRQIARLIPGPWSIPSIRACRTRISWSLSEKWPSHSRPAGRFPFKKSALEGNSERH
jgi:hypothetical protein